MERMTATSLPLSVSPGRMAVCVTASACSDVATGVPSFPCTMVCSMNQSPVLQWGPLNLTTLLC
eukprot:13771457-Heterocapsa_arctica.AAC.1